MFEVEVTDEFTAWYHGLSDADAAAVAVRVDLLEQHGPTLRRPVVGEIKGSAFDPRMKELRVQAGRSNLRVLFTFNPLRTAILLVGGDKAGSWNRWYKTAIPEADRLYAEHLNELRNEGLLT